MKKVLVFLTFVLIAWVISTLAWGNQLEIGKTYPVTAPFCQKLEQAKAVAEADSRGGTPAALIAFQANDCAILPLMVRIVGVKLKLPLERGGHVMVIEAKAQMEDGTEIPLFFLTDQPIIKGQSDA